MAKFRTMKREMAEQIAAGETGVSLEDVKAVIKSYTSALVTCPVCDGSTQFTYRGDVKVPVGAMGRPSEMADVTVGAVGACPLCGPSGEGDPDWLMWHCRHPHNTCNPGNRRDLAKDHETCGWVVTVPYEK